MAEKIRITATAVNEYDLDPEHYEPGATPEQALAYDLEAHKDDLGILLGSDTVEWSFRGELVDTARPAPAEAAKTTREMVDAAAAYMASVGEGCLFTLPGTFNYFDLGHAMLSAAPTPPAQPVEGWRDMASAPKDGTLIVATGLNWGVGPDRHYVVVSWGQGPGTSVIECWREASEWSDESSLHYLDGWTPLPAPPTSASQDSQEGAEHG